MDRDSIQRLIAKHEDWKNTTYTDTEGHPSVGVGFNLDRDDAQEKIEALGLDYDKVRDGTQSLTDAQVNQLYQADLDSAISNARDQISNFDELNDDRQAVVVDMMYNLGPTKFAGFTKMIDAIESNDWDEAAAQMEDSHWYDQVGSRGTYDVNVMQSGEDSTGYL